MEDDKLVIRPKGEDGFKTFSIRIREDIVTRIEQISSETNRSRNELIGLLLDYALDRCVIEKGRKPQFQNQFQRKSK